MHTNYPQGLCQKQGYFHLLPVDFGCFSRQNSTSEVESIQNLIVSVEKLNQVNSTPWKSQTFFPFFPHWAFPYHLAPLRGHDCFEKWISGSQQFETSVQTAPFEGGYFGERLTIPWAAAFPNTGLPISGLSTFGARPQLLGWWFLTWTSRRGIHLQHCSFPSLTPLGFSCRGVSESCLVNTFKHFPFSQDIRLLLIAELPTVYTHRNSKIKLLFFPQKDFGTGWFLQTVPGRTPRLGNTFKQWLPKQAGGRKASGSASKSTFYGQVYCF